MSFVSENGHGLVVLVPVCFSCLVGCFSRLPDYLMWVHAKRLDNWDLL